MEQISAITDWLGLLVPVLLYMHKGLSGRLKAIEADLEALRLAQVKNYHTKSEIKDVVDAALAPLLVALANIERQLTGHTSLATRTTGRHRAYTDDGN